LVSEPPGILQDASWEVQVAHLARLRTALEGCADELRRAKQRVRSAIGIAAANARGVVLGDPPPQILIDPH
jgi:hypothetical protein